jgi:hypothetical protein
VAKPPSRGTRARSAAPAELNQGHNPIQVADMKAGLHVELKVR